MTSPILCKHVFPVAAALALAGCGGGAGGGVSFVPAPPPAPPPPPPPPQSAFAPFPGVTESTEFAVAGLEANNRVPSRLTGSGFSVHFDAASGSYVMSLPSTGARVFELSNSTPSEQYWYGELLDLQGSWLAMVTVLKPSNADVQLSYTTLAGYDTSGMSPEPFGWFAFGIPTSEGSVPVTGNATYDALVRGSSIDNSGMIGGTASLVFDFAAGSLSGYMDPVFHSYGGMGEGIELGRYSFADTVYSSGSTTFSGLLTHPGFTQTGSFSGQFMGPGAEELMGSWSAPFGDPITSPDQRMFGVLVGAR